MADEMSKTKKLGEQNLDDIGSLAQQEL